MTMSPVSEKNQRALDERSLNVLFHKARSANAFLPEPVPDGVLERLIGLTTLAPTSMNNQPLRVVFVTSAEARARLKPALFAGNVAKMESAPVTAILARDLEFHRQFPRVFPHAPQAYFDAAKENAEAVSLQNATMESGYFILAARALGLDAGPMGGFDNAAVDAEFFPDGKFKSILLVTLGYGDDSKLFPRNPRLDFSEVAAII